MTFCEKLQELKNLLYDLSFMLHDLVVLVKLLLLDLLTQNIVYLLEKSFSP